MFAFVKPNIAQRKWVEIVLLCFLCLTLVAIWFHTGKLFGGGEEGLPFYNLDNTFKLNFYALRDSEAGFPNLETVSRSTFFAALKLFYDLGIPGVFLQAGTFFIFLFTGAVASYLLLHTLILEDKNSLKGKFQTAPLIGSLFYIFNPYSMTQVWGRGLYTQFFPFAFFPLFLLCVVLTLKRKNLFYVLFGLVTSFIFAGSFGNLSYLLSFWLLVSLYFLFYFIGNKDKKIKNTTLIVFFLILAAFILLHIWWLSYSLININQLISNRSTSMEHNLGTLIGISRVTPFSTVIRLLHTFLLKNKIYGENYTQPLFVLISWFIPVVALFSIQKFRRLQSFKFYLFLFLITLFIVLGSNPPLGMIFVWLFKNIAFLQAFRNPYEKIGILLTIAYTPFFAIGLVVFSEYLSKIVRKILPLKTYVISAVILFMLFGIYALPMWTGKFAGGNVFNPWIKVPDYYKDANNWVNERVSTHRILHLPLNPGDGIRYIWPDIYQGSDINEFLFDAHSISRNVAFNKIYYNVLLERFDILQKNAYGPDPDISNSEFKGRTFAEEMAKLNVKYIILHKDIDTYFIHTWSSDDTKIFLENQAGIRRVSEFGNLEIYEVDLPSSLNIIYTEGVESSSIALTPVDYRVTVLEAKTPYYLNLLMPYSNSWQVKIGKDVLGRGSPLFSYANSWKIDRSGNYEIEVRYLPQQYIYKGLIVSLISIPLMIGLFIIIQRRVFQNG